MISTQRPFTLEELAERQEREDQLAQARFVQDATLAREYSDLAADLMEIMSQRSDTRRAADLHKFLRRIAMRGHRSPEELAVLDRVLDRGRRKKSIHRGFQLQAADLLHAAGVGHKEACDQVAAKLDDLTGGSLDELRKAENANPSPLISVGRYGRLPALEGLSNAEAAKRLLKLLQDEDFGAAFDPTMAEHGARVAESWLARGPKRFLVGVALAEVAENENSI